MDGGQTWQDISEGLPEPAIDDYGVGRNDFFADDNGLFLSAGNRIYHNQPNYKTPFWKKEDFPDKHSSIAPGTAGGTIFIGSDRGLFKSTNSGKSWKQLPAAGWGKMVESNGVLLATSQGGILRSTDDGESWALVLSEGGVGIDVASIQGGFAAITYSTVSKTRRIRTSYDGGKTWQAIDAGLQAHGFIDSILPPVNANLPAQGCSNSTRKDVQIICFRQRDLCHTDGVTLLNLFKPWRAVMSYYTLLIINN